MQNGKHQHKEDLLEKASDMFRHGSSVQEIELELIKQGSEPELISDVLAELRKEFHKKNLKEGRSLILAGCIVMVVGFVLTCIKFHSNESVNIVMYGFTTMGICILFVGLYKVFN